MSRFEGRARKEETGERLDSVRAVLAEGAYFELLTCFFMLTAVFPLRGFELDAAPELGAHDVAALTARGLGDGTAVPVFLSGNFWASTSESDSRFSIYVTTFDEVWETAVAVSLRESALRALDGSLSLLTRELLSFLWSSWGTEMESGIDEVREMAEAVSIIDSEGGFRWESTLRALESSLSVRELRVFRWSSRGTETESGFNELGRVWERVI